MSSSENYQNHENSSQCPDCNKKYISSSQEQQQQQQLYDPNEVIAIPIRKDMLSNSDQKIHAILKNLQIQVQNLKQANVRKDRIIQDLRKQLDHRMQHQKIYGEIHRQTDKINRLKNEISYETNSRNSRQIQLNQDQIRQIVRQQSKKLTQKIKYAHTSRVLTQHSKRKTYSTRDNYSELKRQFLSPKMPKNSNKRKNTQQQSAINQYFFNQTQVKQIFNLNKAKQKMSQLETKIKLYEKQMLWMSNFVCTFIKTMQNIAYKKYQQQIIIPQWSLKKKAKTSWRYMKHVFYFVYSENQG